MKKIDPNLARSSIEINGMRDLRDGVVAVVVDLLVGRSVEIRRGRTWSIMVVLFFDEELELWANRL